MKWALRVAFVLAITALSWFSLPAAVIALAATILVSLQDRAATLIEVSFGPLRAKLERDVSEAEKLVAKLKQFAGLQAKTIMQATIRSGRFMDQSGWQLRTLKDLEAALRDLGLGEEELREARSDFVRYTGSDLGSAALGAPNVPMHLGAEAIADWKSISHKGLEKTPDEIEAFLKKWESLTPERQQLIDDMRWVLEHQDVRDAEQYARAHERVKWPGEGR